MFSLNKRSSLLDENLSSVCGKNEFDKYLTLSWITETRAKPIVSVHQFRCNFTTGHFIKKRILGG
jgi:hypothetical protein